VAVVGGVDEEVEAVVDTADRVPILTEVVEVADMVVATAVVVAVPGGRQSCHPCEGLPQSPRSVLSFVCLVLFRFFPVVFCLFPLRSRSSCRTLS